jgi:hypothetical protein
MERKKLIWIIPVISALVLAGAIGIVAFSSSFAADGDPAQEDGTDQPLPWKGYFWGKRGPAHGGRFGFGTGFDYDAFLAEELGVTVEELQAARQAAHDAALDEAVAEGLLTEEQADLISAGSALRLYLDPQELLSQALGVDAEELEAARSAGQPLHELFADMEPEEIREAMQAAYQDALQQAVEEGIITESQAEQLQEKGFPGGFLGRRAPGFHGRGGFFFPPPSTESDSDI